MRGQLARQLFGAVVPGTIGKSGNDVPNVNPVQDKTEPVKLTEDGKVDPTTIAKAEDFGDWEEETGCRG